MLFGINRFYYKQLKEIIERHDQRQYRVKHILEIISLIIFIMRILLHAFIYYGSNRNLSYDPLIIFIRKTNPDLYVQYLIFILLISILGIMGKIAFFFYPVDTVTFLVPYEITVRNVEQCHQCFLPKNKEKELLEKHYRHLLEKIPWTIVKNNVIIRYICWHWNKIEFKLQLKNIDLKKLAKEKPLKCKQTVLLKHRVMIAKLITQMDLIAYVFQIFLGKQINRVELNE